VDWSAAKAAADTNIAKTAHRLLFMGTPRGRFYVAPSIAPPRFDRVAKPEGRFVGTELITIDAPAEEHDAILLDRVARWAAVGPVSFLRANKPVWRLEVVRYDTASLAPDAKDAVADGLLVLKLLALERDGTLIRSRREILLRAMRRVGEGLALTPAERATLHHNGWRWAVELGRWDDAGMAALERRFIELRDGVAALLKTPCDPESEARWSLLMRTPSGSEAAVVEARTKIGHHANRLGIFAEAEAILHYFLFRLDTFPDQA
jgi:hypothetical protein